MEQRITDAIETVIEDLRKIFQDGLDRERIGMATSDFQTAANRMVEYKNDPDPYSTVAKTQLTNAEDQSDYARHELEQLGLRALHTWLLTCELLMSIKQEWLVIHHTQGAQANINIFYDDMGTIL